MSRDAISKLPEDIVQFIAAHSDIADVLALRQASVHQDLLIPSAQ